MDNFQKTLKEQMVMHSFVPMVNGMEGLYYRVENPILYVILIYGKDEQAQKSELLNTLSMQMASEMEKMHCNHMISLGICISEEVILEEVRFLADNIHTVRWSFSKTTGELSVAKGQPSKLLGIEKMLKQSVTGVVPKRAPIRLQGKSWAWKAVLCSWFVILLYSLYIGNQNSIVQAFGLSRSGVLRGEYYRFLTSMFLHSGWMHVMSNGLYLYIFGSKVEDYFGRVGFFVVFFASGLLGGLFSVAFHDVLAIGGSGATYGLLGAVLLFTKTYGERYTGINYSTLLLLAFCAISFGLLGVGIDNFAHLGGFIGGAISWGFLHKMKVDK